MKDRRLHIFETILMHLGHIEKHDISEAELKEVEKRILSG